MLDRQEIRDAVFRAMERVRELLMDEEALSIDESVVLLGEGAALDSMGYINFVVSVEEEMSRITDQPLNLVEILNSPDAQAVRLATVGEIIDFLHGSMRS